MNNSRLRARVALPWRGSKKAAKERLPVIEALSRRSTKASHAPRHLLVVRTGAATPLLCLCAVALIRQATRAGGLSGLGGFPLFRWTRTTFKLRVQLTQAARPGRPDRSREKPAPRSCARPPPSSAPPMRRTPYMSAFPRPYNQPAKQPVKRLSNEPAIRSPLGELDLTRFIVHRHDAG